MLPFVLGPRRPRRRSLHRLLGAVAGVVVTSGMTLAMTVGVSAPAQADVSGSTSSGDFMLFDRCVEHPINYDLVIGPGTTSWSVEITVADPNGFTSQGTIVSSAKQSPTKGTIDFQFCGAETPGTWKVHASGAYQVVVSGASVAYTLPTSTFEVIRPASHTRLHEQSLGHGHYRLSVRVTDQRPKGFRRTASAHVRLERLVHGHWRKFGSRLETFRGRVSTQVGLHAGTKVRAVTTAATDSYAGSTSRTVRLR